MNCRKRGAPTVFESICDTSVGAGFPRPYTVIEEIGRQYTPSHCCRGCFSNTISAAIQTADQCAVDRPQIVVRDRPINQEFEQSRAAVRDQKPK